MKKHLQVFLVCALVSLACCVTACTSLFFYPQKKLVRTPAAVGLEYEDIWLETSDGVVLHGWRLPAIGKPWATVVHFHGNAENISTHLASVYWLPAEGVEVFLFDYRGYGMSEGVSELEGLHTDVVESVEYVARLKRGTSQCIIVYGQSLGGSVALTALASTPLRDELSAIVVESAFSDYRKIARDKLDNFWLTWLFKMPLSLTINNEFSPIEAIEKLNPTPILLIHGKHDPVVPFYHAKLLYEAAGVPKLLWQTESMGHSDAFSKTKYRRSFIDYLNSMCHLTSAVLPEGAAS